MAKGNNYFTQMIARYGENFIVGLTPEQIQTAAKRIVKELVKADYDLESVGQYFLDLKFLDNLIISISNELDTNKLYFDAVSFYKMYYPDYPAIGIQQNHLGILCNIYNTILQKLQTVRSTGNIGWLADTSALLYNYRNHLI